MAEQTEPARQVGDNGELLHLLRLEGLEASLITAILDLAETYQRPAGEAPAHADVLSQRTVANLFFEPSTRTRASFELAAKRLSADVLNLDVNMSSRIKGESILDTMYTLQAMGTDIFVVRDASAGVPDYICANVEPHVSVLNAGESAVSHPTQGLLDLLTIRQHKGSFENLSVAIIGDVRHSRVARSAAAGLNIMGCTDVRLVGPPGLDAEGDDYANAAIVDNIDEAISGADVVMTLRIQHERIKDPSGLLTAAEYLKQYGLTKDRLALAKPDAIVMHPGPMNRDVEIAGEVADGPQSVITEQVRNGLAVRMAVLTMIARSRGF